MSNILDSLIHPSTTTSGELPVPSDPPAAAPATADPTPVDTTSQAPVDPAVPAAVDTTPAPAPATTTPEPAPVDGDKNFRLPGQYSDTDETEWLRQNYAQALNQLSEARQRLDNLELEGLSDAEREVETFRREKAQWQHQFEQMREQQAIADWRNYYSQFVDNPNDLLSQGDTVNMGHHVLTNLHKQLSQAKKDLEALKKAAQPPSNTAPPVTTNAGGGGSPARSFADLINNPAEYERILRKAQTGQLGNGDIPM
jgi:hypothetical protein